MLYVLAKSSRGHVLFSLERLNQLRAAWRSRSAGLSDNDLEWEGSNGGTCSYSEDANGDWTYQCDGEFYTGTGSGGWAGYDAFGNIFNSPPPGGWGTPIASSTTYAPNPIVTPSPIDWGSIATTISNWFSPSGSGGNGSASSGPPATNIGPCPPGTGRGKRGANDYECTPFDPPSSSSGQRQRDAGQQAAMRAAAQRAAQQQQQNGNKSGQANGWPWWVWLVIGVGAYEVLK